jgi:protein-S-isoprenylcysteine O-methyltransferase Ste14
MVIAAAIIGAAIGVRVTLHPVPPPSNGRHLTVSIALWLMFVLYWAIASRNSARTASAESPASTALHQGLLLAAALLLFWPVPGLNGWFLPREWTATIAIGAVIQAAFLALAVWARRHLGRNWAAEVRIGEGHELVRTGPYRWLRHPIYTAMLGMFLGTAIASSQYHALVGLALLLIAYVRKTRLEEDILTRTFPATYEEYRKNTWRLVPPVF